MSKTTPGRWEINDLGDGSAEIIAWDCDVGDVVTVYNIVVPALYYDDDNSIADANVLVASKDLLKALEAVVSVADRATDEFDMARKAIARAKGVKP